MTCVYNFHIHQVYVYVLPLTTPFFKIKVISWDTILANVTSIGMPTEYVKKYLFNQFYGCIPIEYLDICFKINSLQIVKMVLKEFFRQNLL